MTDFYPHNRGVCSTRSHGPLLYAFCLCFYFKSFVIHIRANVEESKLTSLTLINARSVRNKALDIYIRVYHRARS